MFQAKHFNKLIFKEKPTKQHEFKTKWCLSCFVDGLTDPPLEFQCASVQSASYTTCSKQKSTLRTSSGHSLSTLNILFDSTAKASANTIFPPFSKETGKLNEKQQVATFWSRLGSKLTNQKTVVFPERSSS